MGDREHEQVAPESDVPSWERMEVHHAIDGLARIHVAIQEWVKLDADRWRSEVERRRRSTVQWPISPREHRTTARTLCASLAVCIAAVAESAVDRLNMSWGSQYLKKGQVNNRPNWGDKKTTLEASLNIRFEGMAGYAECKRARLLGNCFKHSDGLYDEELATIDDAPVDSEIAFEREQWGLIIARTKTFLLEVTDRANAARKSLDHN